MRASLPLCAALSLLCVSLSAELLTETGWESWRDNSLWSGGLSYAGAPLRDWNLRLTAESETERDGSFDRESSRLQTRWLVLRRLHGWSGGLALQTNRSSDESLSGESEYRYERVERSAGLRLEARLTDELAIDNEWRWSWRDETSENQLANRETSSDGLKGESALRWSSRRGAHRFDVSSTLDYADLAQDSGVNWRHNLGWSAQLARHEFNADLTLTDNTQDIYQDFTRTDRQRRRNWRAEAAYATHSLPLVNIETNAIFDRLDNRFDQTNNRDYEQDLRQLDLRLEAPVRNWTFSAAAGRISQERSYDDQSHDLLQEEWTMTGEAAWAFTPRDTLRFFRSARLLRSDMPHAVLRTDNDLLENAWSLGGVWLVRDRVRLAGVYDWRRAERVYIDAKMSGENNTRTRHLVQPTLAIAAGRGFLVEQTYSLLADYSDYRWNMDRSDRFYRQFTGEWRIAWDQSPMLDSVSDFFWPTLSGFAPEICWNAETSYKYIHSEGGDWSDGQYLIDDEQERHNAVLRVARRSASFDCSLGAEMTWAADRELRTPMRLNWRYRHMVLQAQITPQCKVQGLRPGSLEGVDLPYPRLTRELEWQAEINLSASF